MGILRTIFILSVIMLTLAGASASEVEVKIHEGVCYSVENGVQRRILVNRILLDDLKIVGEEYARYEIVRGSDFSFEGKGKSIIRYSHKTDSLFVMLFGEYIITTTVVVKVQVPQGYITFYPGTHQVVLDGEKLLLRTHDGKEASLSTPDRVSLSTRGWLLVSYFSGLHSLIQDEGKP